MKNRGALFVVTRSSQEWKGAAGIWIMIGGWAKAAENLWGNSIVCTRDRNLTADQTLELANYASKSFKSSSQKSILRKFIPEILITFIKDIKLYLSRPNEWPVEKESNLNLSNIKYIIERHDLFSGVGFKLAKRLSIPFILLVDAPVVWEAKKWGVNRGIWGWFLEKNSEVKSLKQADLVLCISEKVKEKVVSFGVSENKIRVVHNKINSVLFHPSISDVNVRSIHNLENKFVIGWTGSFRKFHGLDALVNAFAKLCAQRTDLCLILVGNGQEYIPIQKLVHNLGISDQVIFADTQPYSKIPEWISCFDIGIVSARSSEDFHYSPLKLQEYFALGKPTIIPRAGDLNKRYSNRKDTLFYEAGNSDDLSKKITELLDNKELRTKLSKSGLEMHKKYGSWEADLKEIEKYFERK
ncbi:glycosyltransferase family 4 protein [Marivirga sp.]|uniref:glycosyltransferase family 4 protein n=1 Tax=Marivirga sp. TaxID=2018662 RepID=UPI003DA6E36A